MVKLNLDVWQKEILDYDGDILLNKGRRIGGTEIFAIKGAKAMAEHPGLRIVFVSLTEDQAQLIISVAHNYALDNYRKLIGKGKFKPTLNKLFFSNGSSMIVRPMGSTGNALRSFGADILGIDEAPWQNPMIWRAARPIITTSAKARIWMWGSPGPKEGYCWEQYERVVVKGLPSRFRVWDLNSEDVLLNRPISSSWTVEQHDNAVRILAEEKASMSKLEYANEYLAQWIEDVARFFPDALVESAMVLERPPAMVSNVTPMQGVFFLGVDVARFGGDESTFEVFEKVKYVDNTKFLHRDSIVRKGLRVTETVAEVLALNLMYGFKNIFVDDGGLGAGVFDMLLLDPTTRNKVVAINNAARSLTPDEKRKRKLLKEDLYVNCLRMLERGDVCLLKDPAIFTSFKSIVVEHDSSTGSMRIYGRYSHIVEGIIRAAWANHSTRLELWCR